MERVVPTQEKWYIGLLKERKKVFRVGNTLRSGTFTIVLSVLKFQNINNYILLHF